MFSMYTPKKNIPDPGDPFFEEGNIALRAYWLERDAASRHDAAIIRAEANMLTDELQRPVYCDQPQCLNRRGHPLEFPNTAAYALHYEVCHAHACIECHKPFPSAIFLDIHLDECHNVLLQIKKERGEKIYACFVENCAKKFISPKMRRLHLVDKHLYPRNFPFDIVWTGSLSFEQRQAREKKRHHSAIKNQSSEASAHEKEKAESTEASSMDLDMLTSEMAKLSIPKTISFGRARPSIIRNPPQEQRSSDMQIELPQQQQQQQQSNSLTKKKRKRGPKKKKQQPMEME